MKRWLWISALCAITVAGIVYGLLPQAVPVEAANATVGPLRVTVEEEGKTRLRSRYIVSAPVSGFMTRLALKAGDHVKSGDVITRLSPVNAPFLDTRARDTGEARVRVALAALEVANSRIRALQEALRSAEVDLSYWMRQQQREQGLVKSGDLPAQRLDQTATEVKRAEAAVAAARANIETANMQIDSAEAEVSAARAALGPSASKSKVTPRGETIPVKIPAGGRVIRVIQENEGVEMPTRLSLRWKCCRRTQCRWLLVRGSCCRVGAALGHWKDGFG
jgi:HlyD family secretion protein